MGAQMEVEQSRQKTKNEKRAFSGGEQVLVFFRTLKIGEIKKFTSLYKGP